MNQEIDRQKYFAKYNGFCKAEEYFHLFDELSELYWKHDTFVDEIINFIAKKKLIFPLAVYLTHPVDKPNDHWAAVFNEFNSEDLIKLEEFIINIINESNNFNGINLEAIGELVTRDTNYVSEWVYSLNKELSFANDKAVELLSCKDIKYDDYIGFKKMAYMDVELGLKEKNVTPTNFHEWINNDEEYKISIIRALESYKNSIDRVIKLITN
ncbi:hypothetical protein [Bacillus sp. FJAT-27445]|uniref:hypothetical protein n=1 Tax=Bacillus sp. FJAT-27445 TaxID=1679166 RepID=UPI0007439112|nr:hypothetical protein [Bacillus sp. FJAT-27445]